MSKWLVLGGLGALILATLIMFASTYNTAVSMEEGIIAAHDESRNVLGQHAPKIREALGVTKFQAEDLQKLFESTNSARYGDEGSKAMMQWITEQNPNLDQSNYGKIITMLEASRNDFAAKQRMKIDRVRVYRNMTRSFFTGFILRTAGFPKPAIDDSGNEVDFFAYYGRVIVSGHAQESFQTGIDNGVDMSTR